MAIDLKGQVAVITGASRGIGRACALALAKEGVNVVLTSRTESELEQVSAECGAMGVRSLFVVGDAAKPEDVQRVRVEAERAFGQVDILINNTGVAKYGSFLQNTVEDYDWMMDTNMRSTFLFTRALLPGMVERKSGTVIVVSSQAGLNGYANEAVYCATKHAQVGFAEALDREYREHNIKVSLLCPGGVSTYFAFGTGRTPGWCAWGILPTAA
jgi:short-subunit dehydrogenase